MVKIKFLFLLIYCASGAFANDSGKVIRLQRRAQYRESLEFQPNRNPSYDLPEGTLKKIRNSEILYDLLSSRLNNIGIESQGFVNSCMLAQRSYHTNLLSDYEMQCETVGEVCNEVNHLIGPLEELPFQKFIQLLKSKTCLRVDANMLACYFDKMADNSLLLFYLFSQMELLEFLRSQPFAIKDSYPMQFNPVLYNNLREFLILVEEDRAESKAVRHFEGISRRIRSAVDS